MFKKILIANRGEIACRIIHTARRLGIATVAIYSDADRSARHVELADEAEYIGPAPAAESYLNINNVMKAVRSSGADAVHPGYGFLAENPKFAERLKRRKVTLIGPAVATIRKMGDKLKAKQVAIEAGVSTVPGSGKSVSTAWSARRIAQELGYPVILKASAGGGGKGMRVVEDEDGIRDALRSAANEAKASFGDSHVFIEKYITNPRHIEIQILADTHGNVIYLGERECSIQRRHQKVVEEAPSSFVDGAMRQAMGEQAVALAKAVGYVSAGTVEFIVEQNGAFYFLEMNTRLQVEHPVTERITGLDLVEQMIHIAAGEKLKIRQRDVHLYGWAIETRIYAEDPARGFLPSVGRLVRYIEPAGADMGEDSPLRIDSGVAEGDEITRYYDPMIAKVITSGPNRDAAIAEMRRALDQFYIEGIAHNVDFLGAVMAHPRFIAGDLSTNFIADHFGARFDAAEKGHDDLHLFAAVGATMHRLTAERDAGVISRDLEGEIIPRVKFAISEDWVAVVGVEQFPVKMAVRDNGADLTIAGDSLRVRTDWTAADPVFHGRINGNAISMSAVRTGSGYLLTHGGAQFEVKIMDPRAADLVAKVPARVKPDTSNAVLAPMPGLLLSFAVEIGQEIKAGEAIAVIEAMKMENQLLAERDGVVKAFLAEPGDSLRVDQPILEFR